MLKLPPMAIPHKNKVLFTLNDIIIQKLSQVNTPG